MLDSLVQASLGTKEMKIRRIKENIQLFDMTPRWEEEDTPLNRNQPVPSSSIKELSASSKTCKSLPATNILSPSFSKMSGSGSSEIGVAKSINALTNTVSLTSIGGAGNMRAITMDRASENYLARPLYGGTMKRSGRITSGEIERSLDSSHADYFIAPVLSKIQEEENEGVGQRGRDKYDTTRSYRSSSSSSKNSSRSFYGFDEWKKAQLGRHPSRSPQPSDEKSTHGEENEDGRKDRKEELQHQDYERRQRINQFIQSAKRNSARTRYKR